MTITKAYAEAGRLQVQSIQILIDAHEADSHCQAHMIRILEDELDVAKFNLSGREYDEKKEAI